MGSAPISRGARSSRNPSYGKHSYGRGSGRSLRPSLRALLREALPQISIDLPAPGACLDLAALFGVTREPAPWRPLWLEIGFGAGEHLAWQARRNPEVRLLGAEVFVQGVARLLRQMREVGLPNLRIYCGDARELLACMPHEALDRVFVLFPDPWPKTRHHKRRIVQGETLDRLATLMRCGAELRLATDDPVYADWILEHLNAHSDFEWLARAPADWRVRPDDWPPTRYEAKALEQGRRPVYLRYRRRTRAR